MALQARKTSFGDTVYVDDKNRVYTGTPDYGAHGDKALSRHLFNKTGLTFDQYSRQQEQKRQQDIAKEQAQERAAFNQQQQSQEQDFLKRYQGAIAGQEPLDVMRARLEEEAGIKPVTEAFTGLTQSVNSLQNTLNTLPQRVKGETRGFDVNANQLARIQEARAIPLQQNLGQLSGNLAATGNILNTLQGQVGQRLQTGVAQQERQLQPFQYEASLMSDRLARETTGFNQDRQNQLDLLMNQIQSGQQMTLAQMKMAHDLAMQENQFENAKNQLKFQSGLNLQEARNMLPIQKELTGFQTDEAIRKALATRGSDGSESQLTFEEANVLEDEWNSLGGG